MWNKEKIVFVLSLLLALVVSLNAVSGLRSDSGSRAALELEPPQERASDRVGPVTLTWHRLDGEADRDPFALASSWDATDPDELPAPRVSPLVRRIPVPAPVAATQRARPPRQPEQPE